MPERNEHERVFHQTHVGPHIVELELPDIMHVHYHGDVELAHFLALQEPLVHFPPTTLFYLLRDARHGGLVAAETRQHIASIKNPTRVRAVVTYGSSFQTKTVFENMNRALRRVRPNVVSTVFFETEEQARAWIAQDRAQST